jgi:hypothetical protein
MLIKKIKCFFRKTYYLFPCEDSSLKKKVKETDKQKGVSLIVALMTIVMIIGFMKELILFSAVNTELSLSLKNKIKSEYIAKSGLNLGIFLYGISWGIDIIKTKIDTNAKLVDSGESYWNFINKLPPIGSNIVELLKSSPNQQDTFNVKGLMNEDASKIMALFEDQFVIKIHDEDRKINVNDCAIGRCNHVVDSLTKLFSCSAEKEFLIKKGIRPKELAYRIKDFINKSSNSTQSGLPDKDSAYAKYDPPYKTKKLPLDSLSELKLVEGMDEQIYRVFSPYLTIYPFNISSRGERSFVNINTASQELLGCIVPEAKQESCYKNFALKMNKINSKNKALTRGDIAKPLREIFCYRKDPEKSDIALEWFDIKSWVFRISVQANTGGRSTIVEAVIKKMKPKDKDRLKVKDGIKRSYKLLAWSMDS